MGANASDLISADSRASSGFYRPLTLASAETQEGDGGSEVGGGSTKAEANTELAKKLSNPIANLISLPLQHNWDWGYGSRNAMRYTLNTQPVIPFHLNDQWNLITRTIIPTIYAEPAEPGDHYKFGLGDTLQSLWLSPQDPVKGWILGGGAALLYPTATGSALGAGKWGAGPTIVALRQSRGWTYGALWNHVWSYAGWTDWEVNSTFIQPFVTYTFKTATTLALNSESTYNWQAGQWTVPLNLMVNQIVRVGKVPLQLQVGGRWYPEHPPGGPHWGLRFTVTVLLPK